MDETPTTPPAPTPPAPTPPLDPAAFARLRRTGQNETVTATYARLGAALRRVTAGALSAELGEAAAVALAEQLEALAEDLPAPTPSRYGDAELAAYATVGPAAINARGTHPVFGCLAPVGSDLSIEHVGDELRIQLTYDTRHEGMPHCVHGGHITAGFDYALLQAAAAANAGGPTGTLSVRFLRPTPVGVPVEYRTRITEQSGRRTHVAGELVRLDDGTVCCEGTAVAVARRA